MRRGARNGQAKDEKEHSYGGAFKVRDGLWRWPRPSLNRRLPEVNGLRQKTRKGGEKGRGWRQETSPRHAPKDWWRASGRSSRKRARSRSSDSPIMPIAAITRFGWGPKSCFSARRSPDRGLRISVPPAA